MPSERDIHLGVFEGDIKIWRYLDFTKFVALLESRSLFFCRSDLFLDKFEGSYTRKAADLRDESYRKAIPQMPESQRQHMFDVQRHARREERKNFYINCWHMNHYESAAMWELYGVTGQSVAIQSTYRTLERILPRNLSDTGNPQEGHVDIGIVRYLDYDQDLMPQIYTFDPFLRKRASFSHENEARLFLQRENASKGFSKFGDGPVEPITEEDNIQEGINVDVDLEKLIQKVYVSPDSGIWFCDLIVDVLARYGFEIEVSQSSINDSPLY